MQRLVTVWFALVLGFALAATPGAQTRGASRLVAYEGARLIIGDGSAPVESGTLLVQDGRIIAVGQKARVTVPEGAAHVNLAGRTVMPALVNAHVHIGYEGYTSWSAANYTPENVLDHLRREAYYGVAATQSVGSSPTDASIAFVRDQQAGNFQPASRFFFMPDGWRLRAAGQMPFSSRPPTNCMSSTKSRPDRRHASRCRAWPRKASRT